MHGSLEPDENVMDESLAAKRKAIAICNKSVSEQLLDAIAKLGWDCYDDVVVEIGGTTVLVFIKVRTTTRSGQHLLVFVSITKMLSLLSVINLVGTWLDLNLWTESTNLNTHTLLHL